MTLLLKINFTGLADNSQLSDLALQAGGIFRAVLTQKRRESNLSFFVCYFSKISSALFKENTVTAVSSFNAPSPPRI